MKLQKHILIIVLTLLFFNNCKKYEEDDRRYLKTPCGRIAKKWQLYKITDKDGKDYTNDTIVYPLFNSTTGAISGTEKFVYNGMIFEFDKVNKWLCGEFGLYGDVKCENKLFYLAAYELKFKRTKIKLEVIPLSDNPFRYFSGEYIIYKMTKTEFIFGGDQVRAYFKATD